MTNLRLLVSLVSTAGLCVAAFGQAPAQPSTPVAAEVKDDGKKWDVDRPTFAMHDATIDSDEGTWMSLDVSADGKEIVFDLLGDLYIMPIDGCAPGTTAKQLTSGVSWDMQPKFSPDGKRIAFTSDRTPSGGGAAGDNIWVINRDGTSPVQITKENFRLLNSPSWAPDGEYIVARKHFTARRSLGAGEMWLYHRSGGDASGGLQMTVKTSEQKDSGEPVFSPDGKYLYYSFDASAGGNFEYDKDSTVGIYAINRLDRQTGLTETVIAGPGGACRPTPSPDGKWLAFVRRDRFKTCLFVQDVKSGIVRKVHDGLERDMQETWAIHGVYPSMAWLPDSKTIVYWAAGRIHRCDVETGNARVIPFRVTSTRQVAEALRVPVEVAPEKFDVKMLRWVEVSPKGDKVLFQALGHIYVKRLPDGVPERLTKDDQNFEQCPSFSRDGEWVVYTTWNDEKLGSVRVAQS